MKSIIAGMVIVMMSVVCNSCARVEKVKAVEGGTESAYQSLGTLEVKEKTYRFNPDAFFWTGVEITTLTFADTPSRGEHYKKFLRKKLEKVANKRYNADAVINVQYWPDPESSNFPDGYIYARGEMIQYRRFPSESTQGSVPSYN